MSFFVKHEAEMTSKFMFGLKVVSQDWYWKYNLSYSEAIDKLKYMGVDFIISHNSLIPAVDTAVKSEIPEELEHRLAEYDDIAFRQTIKEAGINYYGSVSYGFAEDCMHKYKNYPVDQNGIPENKIDWYVGSCPTCEEYNEERYSLVENAMKVLGLDGFFLGFMRYPGFWELWLPGTDGEAWSEYCFCPRCVDEFRKKYGIDVPANTGLNSGQWIRKNVREQWIAYKCQVIHDIVRNFRSRIKKYSPDAKVILNTVPFDQENYGGYGRSIFGQDPLVLSDVVDIFEIMGYHQILRQPFQWIGRVGEYFKKSSGKTVVCTAQGKALYTEGMHKNSGRKEIISKEEFESALYSIKESNVDGAVVFTWSDFLRAEYEENNRDLLEIVSTFNKA
jgi:hypothetical protein